MGNNDYNSRIYDNDFLGKFVYVSDSISKAANSRFRP